MGYSEHHATHPSPPVFQKYFFKLNFFTLFHVMQNFDILTWVMEVDLFKVSIILSDEKKKGNLLNE